jgi:TatA/E family protein of Tat protein translocase
VGSLSFSEIMVILVVILIVFGPRRLPELSRRAGNLLAKLREATTYVSQAIDSEYGEAMKPIKELKDELDGLKGDVNKALTSLSGLDEAASPPPQPEDPPPVEEPPDAVDR